MDDEIQTMSAECRCHQCLKLGSWRRRSDPPPRTEPPRRDPPPGSRWAILPPAMLALSLLAACAADNDGYDPSTWPRFASRPVHVQASSELPDEYMLSLGAAVAFWQQRGGVSMTFEVVDPGVPSQVGVPVAGVVAVKPGKPSSHDPLNKHPHAEVVLAKTIGGDVFAAELTLDTCNTFAVLHEVGHALGLPDVDVRGNAMSGELGGIGFGLTDEQYDHVADETLGVVVHQ